MTPVLVDSNVIIDVARVDPTWYEWSAKALRAAVEESQLVINPIVFTEVSIGYERIEDLDRVFPRDLFRWEQLPYDAAFFAAQSFVRYRGRGGEKRSPLPDFFIGAHAAVSGYQLLTRDARRYRTYFPTVDLIAPE